MKAITQQQRDAIQDQRERAFLEACGMDLRYGYWKEDVYKQKLQNPALWELYLGKQSLDGHALSISKTP